MRVRESTFLCSNVSRQQKSWLGYSSLVHVAMMIKIATHQFDPAQLCTWLIESATKIEQPLAQDIVHHGAGWGDD